MIIGGIQKFSLVDYPGIPSAVLFTTGCNMRCGYCHNPELVVPELFMDSLDLEEVYAFLESRTGKLQGVVITGGEPTLRKDLPEMAETIKSMGFCVKLDSNGTNPQGLEELISKHLIDYVAMDIKGPLEKYSEITQRPIDINAIKGSIDTIIDSEIKHEFRTTAVKSQLDLTDFRKMGELIKGAQHFSIQKFVPTKTLDCSFADEKPFDNKEMIQIKEIMSNYVKKCTIR